jgi:cytochrome c553
LISHRARCGLLLQKATAGPTRSRRFVWRPKLRADATLAIAKATRRRSVVCALAVALGAFAPAARAETIDEKAALCAACHGENGVPQQPSTPIIWGQNQGYLYLQLRDFQRGARQNEQMTPLASALTREEMMALAEYFAQRPWPNLRQPSAPEAVAAQAIGANTSVGCTGCHLEQYLGAGTVPRLAGQREDYLARTMAEFRNRTRGNNPGMSDLMMVTSEEQITALAKYLAGL